MEIDRLSGRRMLAPLIVAALLAGACSRSGDGLPAVQSLPDTDVYLVRVSDDDGVPVYGEPLNVTDRAGYDNQPLFLPDESGFLFTAFVDDQADTYRYDLASATVHRVTATPAGEWAPALTFDGQGFTISRNESGEAFQRLWRFPMDGRSPQIVLRDVTGAGYHTWVDTDTVALYIVAEPPELALVDVPTARRDVIAVDVGRCIHTLADGRELLYVDKSDPEKWFIMQLELSTMRTVRRVPALRGREDFAVQADGSLLMGDDRRLMVNRPGGDRWEMLADWTDQLPGEITRLSISPSGKYLAMVIRES
jgi:hypothetical protein